jgi:m7GpppX diphosphatase
MEDDNHLHLSSLSGFVLERHLATNRNGVDSLISLGCFGDRQAIVILNRAQLSEAAAPGILAHLELSQKEQNTYYGFYDGNLSHASVPQKFDVTVICPCKQWHIEKYTAQKEILFRETSEIYAAVTLSYMAKHPASDVAWLHALLAKTAEQDRLLLEDSCAELGFLMYSFDAALLQSVRERPAAFQALVVVQRRDLRTLRDLDGSCLDLLRNIRDRVMAFVETSTGINPEEVRLFLHYKPTYFHLHVHVHHIDMAPKSHKDHCLHDVIDHLVMDSDYYRKKTLSYKLSTADELYLMLQQSS